jgi:peptidoglycan/LPS O-acetylase OafA/YrhL
LKRIPQLDGLRGTAIALVLLHHYIFQFHPSMPDALAAILMPVARLGWSGVDLFFVLSGFLIGGILVDARESESFYSTFYARRAFRILPIYFLILALGMVLSQLAMHGSVLARGFSIQPAPWAYYFTFTQNFFFSRHGDMIWYLQVTWSLAVEEQFYLTLPLLVRKVGKEKLLWVAASLALFCALLRTILYWKGGLTPMQCYTLPFFRFDSLFIGVVCALVFKNQVYFERIKKQSRVLVSLITVFGIAFLVMDHNLWTRNFALHTAGFSVIALFYAAVMMFVLVCPESGAARAFRFQPLMRLGTISYCVYLIHGVVLLGVELLLKPVLGLSEWESWLVVAVGFVATILIAQLSWTVFESRMVALGHRFSYDARKEPRPVPENA